VFVLATMHSPQECGALEDPAPADRVPVAGDHVLRGVRLGELQVGVRGLHRPLQAGLDGLLDRAGLVRQLGQLPPHQVERPAVHLERVGAEADAGRSSAAAAAAG
jgi:hypothetical protein